MNILENKSIEEIASLLRYFIDTGVHKYVEEFKKLNVDELQPFLITILSEARKKRGKKGRDSEGKFVPIPTEETIKDILKMVSESKSKESWESIKNSILLFALSRKKFEKEEL